MKINRVHALHSEIQKTFEELKRNEVRLMDLLNQLDRELGYKALGYASLWEYAVRGLGMSESQASAYISVSRKSLQVPELRQVLESGELSVSKAKRITAVLQKSNAEEWIQKAKDLSYRELERELFRVVPQAHLDPKLRQKERLYRVTLSVTDEFLNQLEEAQELLEEQTREIALEKILIDYLDKKDPVRRAERARLRVERARLKSERARSRAETQSKRDPQISFTLSRLAEHYVRNGVEVKSQHSARNVVATRRIPEAIQHQIHLRDRGHCQHILPSGQKCRSRRGLHIHHQHEYAAGGAHEPENLRTYCRSHHQLIHFQREMRLEAC